MAPQPPSPTQQTCSPIPVVLLNLLLVNLVHLETTLASLAVALPHVSFHIGGSLASFVRLIGIKSIPVTIVPPSVFVLLVVRVNLAKEDFRVF